MIPTLQSRVEVSYMPKVDALGCHQDSASRYCGHMLAMWTILRRRYWGKKFVVSLVNYSYEFISHTLHLLRCILLLLYSAKKSFKDGPTLQHTLPPNEKQPFSFITTVSWTFLEPQYETVKSPPPALIFSVPYDVFYPFQMSNSKYGISSGGSSSRGSYSLFLLLPSLAAFVVALQMYWISVEINNKWTNTNIRQARMKMKINDELDVQIEQK